tara:strand:- start:427 stop:798 length:372 start_codon:yes stop_codon:yes gene_type:complete
MNKKKLTTLLHTEQVKVTLTSEQLKSLERQCKRRFNMINRSHMIRQLIIDSIEKENTIKEINKENNNDNYLSYEEYSLVYSVLKDSLKGILEKEKVEEILKKLYYISILDYKQLNIFENNEKT